MDKMPKAYIYTRVSTEMQVDGFSLSAQKEDIIRYANAMGYQIVGEFCDEGKSGKHDKRPEFMRMIESIKANKDEVRYVLVFKLSRFARNAADTLKNLQLMQDCGVDLICIKEGLDSSTATGKLMVTIMSAVAEMELENIHTQTMAGRIQKAKEGKWNGGFAPYGYALVNGALQIAEEEAKTVRYIFQLFVEESLGAIGVAKRLNAEGITKVVRQNGSNAHFTAAFVKQVLDNPVYMGKIAFGRRKTEKVKGEHGKTHIVVEQDENNIILSDGVHEAIVSEEMWNKAHAKREEMGVRKEKVDQDHHYILSGLVRCPHCNQTMYGVPNRKKKADGTYYKPSYAYKCRKTKGEGGVSCTCSKQYNCEVIDEEFASAIVLSFLTPDFIDEAMKRLNKDFDISELETKLSDLKARLKELQDKQGKYEQEQRELSVADKHYDRKFESYARQLETIYDQLDEVESLIDITTMKINNATSAKKNREDAIHLLMTFGAEFDTLPPLQQKQYANMIVDSIEIFPEKRDMGFLKAIHFKMPVFRNYDDFTDVMTIWDYYPDILDEEGNFNGYAPEDELSERNMLAERADEDGNIVVVEEGSEEERARSLALRRERINTMRAHQGLPPISEEEYLAYCRRKDITDECVVQLCRKDR